MRKVIVFIFSNLWAAQFAIAANDIGVNLESKTLATYTFNNSVKDISGNNLDAADFNVSGTFDRFGNENSAINFNGTSYIKFDYMFPLHGRNDSSLSFWYKAGENKHESIIWSNLGNNIDSNRFNIYTLTSGFGIDFRSPQRTLHTLLSTNQSMTDWHNIVITKDGGNFKTYINGQFKTSITLPLDSFPTYTDGWFIGNRPGTNSYNFTGAIDDMNIYSKPLDAEEIQYLYESQKSMSYGEYRVKYGITRVSKDAGSDFWHGTKCVITKFNHNFEKTPIVTVSINHNTVQHDQVHDPIIAWNEFVTTSEFKTCLKDLKDDKHYPVEINWIAK